MWVITCKNNPIHTQMARGPVPPPPGPLPTPTHGDELTASNRVRGEPFVANIWRAAQPIPLLGTPPTHTHGDELTASGASAAQSGWGGGHEG